jgi:hypothetical protein
VSSTRIFIAGLLLLIFALASASCQKEFSDKGGAGTVLQGSLPAQFILECEPDFCFDFLIHANYNPGLLLTIDNTVRVMVNVVSTGAHSLKTATINGITREAPLRGTFQKL